MKYKVGDRVRIKSIDWYNENKNKYGYIECGDSLMNFEKSQFCGKIVTISSISAIIDVYGIKEDDGVFSWSDEMIEGLVEGKPSNENKEQLLMIRPYTMEIVSHKDYEIIQRDSKFFLEKKPKYPQTFLGCCDVLNIENLIERGVKGYKAELFDTLQKLYICRDAYWKIAGEEMGLGKPWEPDWTNQELLKYCIASVEGQIKTAERYIINTILAFPTAEMRDAFYDNFKKDIEECKALL